MEVFAPKSTDIRTFCHVSRHETNKIDHATWPPLRILQCQNPIPMICNPCAISALPWHKACARLGSKAPQICANWGQIRPISRCYAQGYRPISSCITFCIWHFKVALKTIAKGAEKVKLRASFDQICNDHHDPDRSEFERQMDILGLRAK